MKRSKEQAFLRNETKSKEKKCVDCLHCKISKNSTPDCRLCFCAIAKDKVIHSQSYWQKKAVCKKFVNMGR